MRKITLQKGECCDCIYLKQWSENQAPLGSGLNWQERFEDCSFEFPAPDIWTEKTGHEIPCPHWQPVELKHCDKHGDYYARYCCVDCLKERGLEDPSQDIFARVTQTAEACAKHANRCKKCFHPIIDAEGNPGYLSEACAEGHALLQAYMEADSEQKL